MLSVVSIVPARSGSKTLPNKNIRELAGMPLLCHSVEYSKRCDLVSQTIVSTDSTEIAEIARKCGALVPFIRPKEYSLDNSRDYSFMRHALDYLESEGLVFDIYVLLRPTSPLRPPNLIERAIKIFENNDRVTSIRSVAKCTEHPYRIWKEDEGGSICGLLNTVHEPYNIPRQELPEMFFQTGDLEAVRRETLIMGSVSGDNVFPLVIEYDEMLDIDREAEFQVAQSKIGQAVN